MATEDAFPAQLKATLLMHSCGSFDRQAAALRDFEESKSKYLEQKKNVLKKEIELLNSVLKYDEVIQATLRKKVNAETRISLERQTQRETDQLIAELKLELKKLSAERQSSEDNLKKYGPISDYLQKLLRENDKFNDVKDIISTRTTLNRTLNELLGERRESRSASRQTSQELLRAIQTRELEIISRGTKIRQLECEVESKRQDQYRLTRRKRDIEEKDAQNLVHSHQIKLIIHNMFRICQNQDRGLPKHSNTEEQLEKIGEFIGDLEFVSREIQRSQRPASDAAHLSHVTRSRVLRGEKQ